MDRGMQIVKLFQSVCKIMQYAAICLNKTLKQSPVCLGFFKISCSVSLSSVFEPVTANQ